METNRVFMDILTASIVVFSFMGISLIALYMPDIIKKLKKQIKERRHAG